MATRFKDYYETLGVARGATQKEIKSAFRRLARQHHPDVNKDDPSAVERFKEINEAHEVLGDPEKRQKYDEVGPEWERYEQWERAGRPGRSPFGEGSPFSGGGFPFGAGAGGPQVEYRTVSPEELESLFGTSDPFSDFFHSMFGRGGGTTSSRRRAAQRQVAARGQDVEGEATISLAEAYSGTERTIELSEGGRTRRVQVHIPAGISDGARVRAAGQGGAGIGDGGAGDLLIRVRVTPDPAFTREGQNLRTTVAVPLSTALLGGTVTVRTPDGRRVELRVPPETQNRSRLRLRGLGLPNLKGGGRGDLHAEVDVRLPLPLDDRQRTAASTFAS